MMPILEVQDLSVAYRARNSCIHWALTDVSFSLMPGEILGILGESGSGKSTLAASLLRLLPANAEIRKGVVRFGGKDILGMSASELREIRGASISLIFQEPSLALHPTLRAGEQVRQVLAAHNTAGKRALREPTLEVLETVFPTDADRMARSYPHQLSGGQRQRVLIAQAIACLPKVIIADEPTASLDPTTQSEILGVFESLRQKLGIAMIFITHNPALLAGFADRILILYGGRVAELGPTKTILAAPKHPYTQALLRSIPPLFEDHATRGKTRLPVIPGDSLSLPFEGCFFEPRCSERIDICRRRQPDLLATGEAHKVSCFKVESETRAHE